MGTSNEYSVLMSTYYKEKPEYLKQAIESIQKQTIPTDDFVLVCDGKLGKELEEIISLKQEELGNILNVIRLEKNGGLGNALNIGLKHCKHELVARMDSDDISYPDRCEKQIKIFNIKDISICSGIIEEFDTNPDIVNLRRVVPEHNEEILRFSKSRNPFNHPCVMYRKSSVEEVGSYEDFYLLEDYYLWLRMLIAGYNGYNIQEPILKMRAGSEMYKRRSGLKYAKSQIKLLNYMKKQNYINNLQHIENVSVRFLSSILPNWMRKFMFQLALREKK